MTIYENMSIWMAFILLQTSIWLVLEVSHLAGYISVCRDGFYVVKYEDKEAFMTVSRQLNITEQQTS